MTSGRIGSGPSRDDVGPTSTGRAAAVLALLPYAGQVGVARDFCARRLSALMGTVRGDPDVINAAVMITSELVTNAIRAAATAIRLQLEHDRDRVRIVVSDDAAGDVVPATPAPLDTSGRGLLIVAALANQWGVEPTPEGKQVWAELLLPEPKDPSGRGQDGRSPTTRPE